MKLPRVLTSFNYLDISHDNTVLVFGIVFRLPVCCIKFAFNIYFGIPSLSNKSLFSEVCFVSSINDLMLRHAQLRQLSFPWDASKVIGSGFEGLNVSCTVTCTEWFCLSK